MTASYLKNPDVSERAAIDMWSLSPAEPCHHLPFIWITLTVSSSSWMEIIFQSACDEIKNKHLAAVTHHHSGGGGGGGADGGGGVGILKVRYRNLMRLSLLSAAVLSQLDSEWSSALAWDLPPQIVLFVWLRLTIAHHTGKASCKLWQCCILLSQSRTSTSTSHNARINSEYGSVTYSAWHRLAVTYPSVLVCLLEVMVKPCCGRDRCMCGFHINVSGSFHSTGRHRGQSSLRSCLFTSGHRAADMTDQTSFLRSIFCWTSGKNCARILHMILLVMSRILG